MKKLVLSFIIGSLSISHAVAQKGYPIDPVPFTSVKVTPGTFWGQRLEASRKVTIPLAFSKCEETGRYTNFSNAAQHLKDPSKVFKVEGLAFDDTDPYKTIEGASYILQTYPDKKLEAYCDSVIDVIGSAQEPDGYLYTSRTQNPQHPHEWAGDKRWSMDEDLSHELYNLGHMVEGAVAYYQATGKRKFLDIACRYADCAIREVGPNPGQMCVVPGHQIAEMAMARLYLVTGEKKSTLPSISSTIAARPPSSMSILRLISLSSNRMRLWDMLFVPPIWDENDRSIPYTHWWPKKDCTEWLAYEFPEESTVQSATVYWYDDGPWGGCRVPQSWRILYQDAQGQWQPVSGADGYPTDKGVACTVNFDPVKTKALRLEITLPNDNATGLFEWVVK